MAEIILACGRIVLVDEIDYDLSQYNWCAIGSRGNPYAGRGSTTSRIYMHLIIIAKMGLTITENMEPDHRDRNSLNNQRENLRVVSKSHNRHNTTIQCNNTSGVRGVKYITRSGKWTAQLNVNRRRVHLGTFSTVEEATAARMNAEKRYGVK